MNIKLIGTDIDGVWTDAKMYYTDKGDYMKAFSTYDGMAVQILREHNIPVVNLTSEKTKIVKERAKKLGIKDVFIGEKEKLKRMQYLCKKMNISMSEVAYIGDDINDLELLQNVGISGCPIDSPVEKLFNADIITNKKGGEGAFREFVENILTPNPFNDFVNLLIK